MTLRAGRLAQISALFAKRALQSTRPPTQKPSGLSRVGFFGFRHGLGFRFRFPCTASPGQQTRGAGVCGGQGRRLHLRASPQDAVAGRQHPLLRDEGAPAHVPAADPQAHLPRPLAFLHFLAAHDLLEHAAAHCGEDSVGRRTSVNRACLPGAPRASDTHEGRVL